MAKHSVGEVLERFSLPNESVQQNPHYLEKHPYQPLVDCVSGK